MQLLLTGLLAKRENLQYHYHKMITLHTTQGGDRMNMFRVTYEEVVTTELRIALNTLE